MAGRRTLKEFEHQQRFFTIKFKYSGRGRIVKGFGASRVAKAKTLVKKGGCLKNG